MAGTVDIGGLSTSTQRSIDAGVSRITFTSNLNSSGQWTSHMHMAAVAFFSDPHKPAPQTQKEKEIIGLAFQKPRIVSKCFKKTHPLWKGQMIFKNDREKKMKPLEREVSPKVLERKSSRKKKKTENPPPDPQKTSPAYPRLNRRDKAPVGRFAGLLSTEGPSGGRGCVVGFIP